MQKYDEPVFLISVVSKVLEIHPQTLRQYEREGLIEPGRTQGRMRLYSQKDIDKIKMILRLTRDLGVNLAGVDVIFKLKEQLKEQEDYIKDLESELNKNKIKTKSSYSLIKKSNFDIIFYDKKG